MNYLKLMDKMTIKKVFKEMIVDFDYIGMTENGGFFDTPFCFNKYEMFWNVKG